MKQLLHLKTMLVTLLTMLVCTGVFAEDKTSTLKFTKACDGTGTANDGVEWTVTSDASESQFDNSRGIHYGTGNAAVSYLQLSTSGINGTITSIVVNASGASGTTAKLNVIVGGNAFGSEQSLTQNATNYTFEGSSSGEIIVRLSQKSAKKALYVKSIVVNYLTGEDTRIPVTLTYSKDKYTTATEEGEITDAPTLTVDPEAAASEVVFSSSKESVAKFDENGKLIAVSPGTTTITASIISSSTTYRGTPASYTLKVGLTPSNLKYNPTSFTVTYDKKDNFTAPEVGCNNGYDKTLITYTSSNQSVATVNENGEVTILAVGVTTITASGISTEEFKASEASFTLTVNDIKGSVTGGTSLFKETFDNADSNGGNDGSFSQAASQAMDKDDVCDNIGWNGAMYKANKCVKIGTSDETWKVTTPEINVEPNIPYTLIFKAAPWANESSTKMKVTVTGGSIEGISTDNMTTGKWNDFSATITPNSSSIKINFSVTGGKRFFLDEINVTAPSTSETVNVTIPSSGWGTYCCQWPLDLTEGSLPDGFKAYAVSSSSSTNVTITEISQKLIGGTGIIINGTPGTAYTLKIADKGTAYSGTNLLTGTLAPTYVEEGQYFLKSGRFVYSSAGILPANKAYLKKENAPEAAANFDFVVEDVNGISEVLNNISLDDDKWYDLLGRAVSPTSKGIYIHNGKKYVNK